MNKLILIIFAIVTIIACKPTVNINAELEMKAQLISENYFELRKLYQAYKGEISEMFALEVEAHLFNTFNKNIESNKKAKQLIGSYQITDSLKVELLHIQSDNYLKLFEYKKAFDTNNILLSEFKSELDSSQIDDLKNMNNIFESLLNTSPQQVIIKDDNFIPIKRDIAGLMNVEVEIKNSKYDFIFDTGAGMSVIKRSLAEQLGLEILETSINVNSASDYVLKSSLAVVESLQIDSVLVLNSVFLVMEDKQLEFPQANYYPLAIIGFPIIEEFREFSITKNDTLIVPKNTTPSNLANMRLNGLSPNVYLYNGTDSLEFAFDTGARRTHFTSKYFEKYKSHLQETAVLDSVTSSSAGGSITSVSYLMDSCELYIGTQKSNLENIHVHTEFMETFKDVYGNLGQDLISQFNKMTLNFQDMSLKFE